MATSSAVLKIRSEMKMAKKPGGLLRRPLAPIVKPTSVQLKDYSTDTVEMYLNSSSMENGRDHMISPIPSLAPSLASGVQESEVRRGTSSLSAAKSDPYKLSPQQSRVLPHSPVNTLDSRYFLESRFKARTDTGTIGALSLVKPYKPRGPDGLPLRPPKQVPEIKHEYYYQHSDFDLSYSEEQYRSLPEFTLQDFLLDIRRMRKLPKANLQEAMVSKQNFKKLTTLFATFNKLPKQEKINTIEMKTDSIPKAVNRVPQRQLLIETAFLLKQQMKDMMHTDLQAMVGGSETDMQLDFPGREALFGSPDPKYFQGARRSQSPFVEDNDSSVITPSELAILDCLVNGGTALSLKAHFIDILPDMSVLNNTLVYLNISFNEFRVFPTEILDIHGLEVLKLRNNPIKEIPHDIYKLKQLHTLVMSFNQISSLPMSLYTLPLVFLDLSYNRISYLPNELKQLKHLREFNIEGNQLAALPCDAFKLRHLRHLKVTNNYMHPLFWKENSTNQPQRLADMAALVIKQRQLDEKHKLPENLQQIIDSASVCDCCKGPLYGSGLRLIRPCSKAFGIWKLPFYFVSCSPYCRDVFMSSTESLSELLYEDED